jgi:hypothetical protein
MNLDICGFFLSNPPLRSGGGGAAKSATEGANCLRHKAPSVSNTSPKGLRADTSLGTKVPALQGRIK